MHPSTQNIRPLIAGLAVGMLVYWVTIFIGNLIMPFPGDVNIFDPRSIRASAHLIETKHMIIVYLCHAIGVGVATGIMFRMAGRYQFLANWLIIMMFVLHRALIWP